MNYRNENRRSAIFNFVGEKKLLELRQSERVGEKNFSGRPGRVRTSASKTVSVISQADDSATHVVAALDQPLST